MLSAGQSGINRKNGPFISAGPPVYAGLSDGKVRQIFEEAMEWFDEEMLMNFSTDNVYLEIMREPDPKVILPDWNALYPGNTEGKGTETAVSVAEGRERKMTLDSLRPGVTDEASARRQAGKDGSGEEKGADWDVVTAGPEELSGEGVCRVSFLSQLTDIFCREYEVDGGHFSERYCVQSQQMSYAGIGTGNILTGYKIWEVFIRRIILARFYPEAPYSLREAAERIRSASEGIQDCVHDSMACAGELFAVIALSRDGMIRCGDWGMMEDRLCRLDIGYRDCLHHLYRKLHGLSLKMFDTEEAIHRISPLFIRGLGDRFTRERQEAYYRKRA